MDFGSLYKINNKGKIYQWDIKIVEKNDGTYDLVSQNGEKEGKKVVHTRNIPKGKASRTVLEQAVLEAESKRNAKIKKEGYTENLKDLSDPKKRIIIRPMLAHKYDINKKTTGRSKTINFPCAIQRKYDGLRMLSHKNGKDIVMESRKAVIFNNFHKLRANLKKIFKKLSGNFYLDGELYTNDLSFEEISGLSRKLEGGLTEEEEKKINLIHYYVYDCFDLDNMELTFKERNALLQSLPKVKYVNIVETYNAENKEEVREFQKKFVEEGYEGTMLRNYDSTYQLNKRTKDLQKYKDFMEDEFKIIGFTDGEGSEKGQVIWKCVTKEGKEFNVVPIGTREYRKKLFKEAEKHIGKQLTVIFFGYTEKGIPRIAKGKDIREGY